MISTLKTVLISSIISIAVFGIFFLTKKADPNRIVVVDAIRLFNGFKMKVELEEHDAPMLRYLTKRSDSLENILTVMKNNNAIDKKLAYEYQLARSTFQQEYERSNKDINEQVWKRLNPLIAEFGKKEKWAVIIGANGMGSVLYTAVENDATEDAIKFVNEVYEGKK